jgi:hypothetical protein
MLEKEPRLLTWVDLGSWANSYITYIQGPSFIYLSSEGNGIFLISRRRNGIRLFEGVKKRIKGSSGKICLSIRFVCCIGKQTNNTDSKHPTFEV